MALVASGRLGRRCPVCGAPNCSCKGAHESGDGVIITEAEKVRGPMVQVEIRPGLSIQMSEDQARKQGLLPAAPEPKERDKPQDKARRRPATKKVE